MGKKFTFEQVKNYIEIESNSNYKLLSNEYNDANSKLTMMCDQGHIFDMRYSTFKHQDSRCKTCNNIKLSESQTFSYDYVKSVIENLGFNLLEDKYINNVTNMKVKCPNGHVSSKTFSSFTAGKGCWECHLENNKGENNPNWNPTLTNADREKGRKIDGYNNWGYSVFERDDYTCQCCGKKSDSDITAHHMDGYNWCKDRRVGVSNGITLCEKCHTKFHKTYGYGDNTESQFLYWLIENGIGIFNIDEKRKESVLKEKPEPKEPIDIKKYFRDYYEKNGRKYSPDDITIIFNNMIEKYNHPQYFTMTGFLEVSGIHSIGISKLFKMQWIDVLNKFHKKDEVYNYVCEEYLDYYLTDFKCDFVDFYKNHPYISQDLIKQFTIDNIKRDCGFKGSHQQHNFIGLQQNFTNIKQELKRIPFCNEFIKLTNISMSSYYNYFNTDSYEEFILNIGNSKEELEEYELNKHKRKLEISAMGGKASGISDQDKEIEFRRVFDGFFIENNRYPSRREFLLLSKFSDKAYTKKLKITWNQAVERYGYPINKSNR